MDSSHQPPRTVCILRLSAIGDTCHVLPVVRTLQKAWPTTAFSWVIGALEATLMEGAHDIEFITFDKGAGASAYRELRKRLAGRHFDCLLHMHASLRANRVSRHLSAPLRLGFDRARARDFQWLFTNRRIEARSREHVLDGLFGFADALGVHGRELRWTIPVSDRDRDWARQQRGGAQRLVVLSPCSSQRARNYRNWPAERFVAVVNHLERAHGARTLVTGGPSELEAHYAEAIVTGSSECARSLAGRTTLKQLFALIGEADALLCPDSGPAHMATAAGTPVVGLYATSNPGRTGPYLSGQWVVNKYPEAVRREFGKSVDEIRWGRRVRDPRAMELITIDEVNATFDRLFAAENDGDNLDGT